jgi:SAM-dependent methyltransferase
MKLKFLKYLCDPENQMDLILKNGIIKNNTIISGILKSQKNSYPIINGIPRFVKNESYSANFGYQWNRWARTQFDDQNVNGPLKNYTSNMFKSITQFSKKKLHGKLVLDLGCGPGRFTDVAVDMGAIVIALDYSSAIDAAKLNFATKQSNILFIQGDALNLPIKKNTLDYCFSIGVLHHTPSPIQAVKQVSRVLKKKGGGVFAIRVYNKKSFYTFPSVKLWRYIFLKLNPLFKFYPPLIYSYFFGTITFILGKIWRPLSYPLRIIFPTVWSLDYRWLILDTFDAITTSYQSGHTPLEVRSWLVDAGFIKIKHTNKNANDFVGITR